MKSLIFLLITVPFMSFSQCEISQNWYEEGLTAADILKLSQFEVFEKQIFTDSYAQSLTLYKCGSGDYFMSLELPNRYYLFNLPSNDLSLFWRWASDPHPMSYFQQVIKDHGETRPEYQESDYYPVYRCQGHRNSGLRCLRFTRETERLCWQHK